MNNKNKVYCQKCVNPISAVNINFSSELICSACKSHQTFEKLTTKDWKKRKNSLEKIFKKYQKNNLGRNYDCVVPVSGGKDSYYQTHIVQSYGLKPLLVTYDGDNYIKEGAYNRDRMKHVFNADHLVFGPSIEKLKIINLVTFKLMGDMNWHNHCGITTYPVFLANQLNIPLVVWGETPLDVYGMYNSSDYVEMSNRNRIEHDLRGYDSDDIIKASNGKLNKRDMLWSNYPSETELFNKNVRGIFIGNYIKWSPNDHYKQMQKLYGWIEKKKPFERTYRKFSNLDNIFENGAHDYLKFIKFGYGRGTDHSSKDIRSGILERKQGVKNVMKYDHVTPNDLKYWCSYVGISVDEFYMIADKFRSKAVWWIENKKWHKYCIDGKVRSYGFTTFTTNEINKFNKN